jgi:hypothetical protein
VALTLETGLFTASPGTEVGTVALRAIGTEPVCHCSTERDHSQSSGDRARFNGAIRQLFGCLDASSSEKLLEVRVGESV